VLPATGLSTSSASGRVKIKFEAKGMGARKPISIPGRLQKIAQENSNHPALAYKREDNQWNFITYKYELCHYCATLDSVQSLCDTLSALFRYS
jgi:hypothetical protein